ncbi:hypothetical protein IFM89_014390 [Coptis chinensis]|uniref:RNase H type-1 domain-containing protein n=1 Tax=Coptis chinensis TaxID=261450 RepID=A0A835LEB3_9MAGN|nr:hypothetical protein IFM89_014390 [Coptis chinensis]
MDDKVKAKENQLQQALLNKDSLLRGKSKISWWTEGERCTAFFHRTCKLKMEKAHISEIQNENGDLIVRQEEIQKHLLKSRSGSSEQKLNGASWYGNLTFTLEFLPLHGSYAIIMQPLTQEFKKEKHRNRLVFDNKSNSAEFCHKEISNIIQQTGVLSKAQIWSEYDNEILSKWRIPARHIRHQVVRRCTWELPERNTIKINCDGAAKGNPGNAGLGVVYRNSSGDFMLVMWRKLGINTNYLAECLTILEGIECAVQRGWCKLWVESDSEAAIAAFGTGNLPWYLRNRWNVCKRKLLNLKITSTWRGANLSADQVANHAITMTDNRTFVH